MNTTTGQLWYGGPASNAFTIGVVPVMYSGGAAVESVTIVNKFCGAKAQTVSEAPFDFTLTCKSSGEDGDTPEFTVSSGGETDTDPAILNETIFPIYLDYEGPEAPTFKVNPNGREGGWINNTVALVGQQKKGSKGTLDGWLNYGKDAGRGWVRHGAEIFYDESPERRRGTRGCTF